MGQHYKPGGEGTKAGVTFHHLTHHHLHVAPGCGEEDFSQQLSGGLVRLGKDGDLVPAKGQQDKD